MAFETFLTKCQSMFNIYEQEDELMEEDAKIRFLFRKVQHPVLDKTIKALKATIATSPAGTITYTTAANHLSTAVSELPEFLAKSRTVSAFNSEEAVPKTSAIYNADGAIITGHIDSWKSLSMEERKIVMDERKRLKIRYNRSGKQPSPTATQIDQLKKLKNQNKRFKRKIKAMKSKISKNDQDSDEEDIDAGDQFGGKNAKKKAKTKA